ncbi:hypothetical protein LBMAG42_53260 [Deltaproteobacteria bacterium]|nr:hypothetical protein LBMAG42_53260 [Deltaproteobacteria bacterium]
MLNPRTQAALQISLGVGFLALALVGIEAWEARYAWPADPSWYAVEEHDRRVCVRSQQFAPVEFPAAPADGVTRILVAGGSTTFGFPERPVGDEPTTQLGGFVAAMQAALDVAAPGKVELINVGINGGNSEDTLRVLRRAQAWGATGLVLYDGHNEFMNVPAHFSAKLWGFATYRHAMAAAPRASAAPGWVGEAAYGDDTHAAAVLTHFRANLEAIADLGWPTVAATQAGNLYGLDPSWSTTGDEAELRGLSTLSDEALAARWRAGHPSADLAFAYGRRGLGPDSAVALRTAADVDGLPFRASSTVNATIREVGAAHGWTLVDGEAATGDREFYDNVHPLPAAAARLAMAMLNGMQRAGMILPDFPEAAPIPPPDPPEAARRTAAYWLRWACVRQHDPVLRIQATHVWAGRVLELHPDNADALAILALAESMASGIPAALPDDPELRRRLSGIHPCVAELVSGR